MSEMPIADFVWQKVVAETRAALALAGQVGSADEKAQLMWRELELRCQKLPNLAHKLQRAEVKVTECAAKLKEMRRQAHALAVKMPVFIDIQAGQDPTVMTELRRAWAIRPDSDAALRRRWKWLLRAWIAAEPIVSVWSEAAAVLVWAGWERPRAEALFRGLAPERRRLASARRAAAIARERLRSAVRQVEQGRRQLAESPGEPGPGTGDA